MRDEGVRLVTIDESDLSLPTKERYLSSFMKEKLFECSSIKSSELQKADLSAFSSKIQRLAKDKDIVFNMNFGHGLWDNPTFKPVKCDALNIGNVQTNSENFGFNRFDRYLGFFDSVVIDQREARLAVGNRFLSNYELYFQALKMLKGRRLVLTLGNAGSLASNEKGELIHCPTYANEVVDTVGSGDAYFAVMGLCNLLSVPMAPSLLTATVFAGIHAGGLGNSLKITKGTLLKNVEYLIRLSE